MVEHSDGKDKNVWEISYRKAPIERRYRNTKSTVATESQTAISVSIDLIVKFLLIEYL